MLKLGLAIDWGKPRIAVDLPLIKYAERLGFDSVWASEAYGSDALTPLAFIAGQTQHIRLGTGIAQVAARQPAAMAMAMATLDQLAGDGRVICGLGMSGPQVVEGWYGLPWRQPRAHLRDYVAILRKQWQRQGPLVHDGERLQLPYAGDDGAGLGKPLKSILHANPDIPVYLGTGSQSMVELTSEIADGWLPFGFVPGMYEHYKPWLETGFVRGKRDPEAFAVVGGSDLVVTKDIKAAIDALKPTIAFYVGGMGAKTKNFHKDLMIRRGYPDAAQAIQTAFLQGDMPAAIAAVPDEYVDDAALIGDRQRLKIRFQRWLDSGATDLILHRVDEESLPIIAEIADLKPRQ
ncbi:Putative coenzyme F420-dependent oxidoreductase [BD1-7 clade bacterium]|uniref:Coenzyme F420-dependent oxidoreductase n=1 Tax=BD1-7 clade bacterium TaxID=2029982 RepID=A0A5S9R1V5_9GAMM|nr:Putative coenzyme F420-dependent oxidoreductase [BD1-7 clade bacterium]